MPDKRTWKYERATETQSARFVSSDGWEIVKAEFGDITGNRDLHWQAFDPDASGDYPFGCYTSAKAAKSDIAIAAIESARKSGGPNA